MRVPAAASLLLSALLATAQAAPAPPRTLEQIVDEADLVVVAKLLTKPAHPGDPFDVEVEETLKGAPPRGVVRAAAAYFYTGCVPMPQGTPEPKAIEADADRALLFLDAPKDGVRQAHDSVVMREGPPGVSPFYGTARSATLAPEAIRALVEMRKDGLSAEAFADLWEKGLRGSNKLLVECMLLRILLVDRDREKATYLPKETARRALEAWTAARPRLLATAAELASSEDDAVAQRAFEVFFVVRATRRPAEDPLFAKAVEAAAASRKRTHLDVREIAMQLLVAENHAAATDFVLDALHDPEVRPWYRPPFYDGAAELAKRGDPRKEELLAALVACLADHKDVEYRVLCALRTATGLDFATPDQWRAWWKARPAK
jgi:ParB-like chromosome segregation protein Spo0J